MLPVTDAVLIFLLQQGSLCAFNMLCKLIGDSLKAARLLFVFSLALSANEILCTVSMLSLSVVLLVLEVAQLSNSPSVNFISLPC